MADAATQAMIDWAMAAQGTPYLVANSSIGPLSSGYYDCSGLRDHPVGGAADRRPGVLRRHSRGGKSGIEHISIYVNVNGEGWTVEAGARGVKFQKMSSSWHMKNLVGKVARPSQFAAP